MLSTFTRPPDEPWEIRISPPESKRLGLTVGRLNLPFGTKVDPEEIRQAITAPGVDLIVLRYPAERVDLAARIQHPDYVSWPADTLVYYGKGNTPATSSAGKDWKVLTRNRAEELREVVRQTFASYGNHYSSNPALDPQAARDGYVEWALSFLETPNSAVLVGMENAGATIAWFCSLVTEGPEGEIVLGGVNPLFRRRGLYTKLLEAAETYFGRHGVKRMAISTQAANRTVITIWIRNGYNYLGALNTLHMMPWKVFHPRAHKWRLPLVDSN